MVKIKRVYDVAATSDGHRVLVDRLWPRGLKKTDVVIDEWLKDIAPSDGLRKWFGHDAARWEEFKKRYRLELRAKSSYLERLHRLARKQTLTLVFSARDEKMNNAVVIRDVLKVFDEEGSA